MVQWLTLPFKAAGVGSIPRQGAKILQAIDGKKNENIKHTRYCNKFNKDFKNGPHQKSKIREVII